MFDWLGVDADIPIKNAGSTRNALPGSFKKVKGSGLLHDFRSSYIWNKIAPLVPDKITSAAAKLTVEETSKSSDKDAELISYLKPVFTSKIKKLEGMLNKKFDEWGLNI